MPFSDDKMPFYALGVNIARQVGGQTGFKSLLNQEEIELVLSGFSDSLRGTATQEDMVGTMILFFLKVTIILLCIGHDH